MSRFEGLSAVEVDEIQADAANYLNDKGISLAFKNLELRYVEALKAEQVGSLTVPTLHASLRVLEDLKTELRLMISETRFRQRKGSN